MRVATSISQSARLPVNIRVLCLTGFIEGLIALGPLWALYVDELQGSLVALGALLSAASLSASVFQIPGGLFSDRCGRKRALIIGELVRIVSFIFIGWVPSWEWLVPGIIISSLAGALINPAKSALVAESVASERRGQIYGLVDTIQALTMIVGPALGLWIAGRMDIRLVFFVSAGLAAVSLCVTLIFLEDGSACGSAEPAGMTWLEKIRSQFAFSADRNLNMLLLSQGLSMVAASFAMPFFTLFAVKDLSVAKEKLAWVFVLSNALLMLTRIPMGYLADHPLMKRKYLLVWGCAWGAVVWIAISFSRNYYHLFSYALLALAFVLPARSALISDLTLPRERASVFGTLSAVDGISGALGYAVAGVFAKTYGMRLSMQLAGIGLLGSAAFVGLFFKERRAREAEI